MSHLASVSILQHILAVLKDKENAVLALLTQPCLQGIPGGWGSPRPALHVIDAEWMCRAKCYKANRFLQDPTYHLTIIPIPFRSLQFICSGAHHA